VRVVVETHADDAYLSVGSFLRDWAGGDPLMLVTVFSGTRDRARDAARYADEVGAEWVGLGLVEAEPGNADGEADLPGVADDLAKLAGSAGVVMVGPLGLGHPEHRGVAAALPEAALRYVDLPVAGRRKTRSELAARTVGRTVDALRIATARDFDCHDLFRDQARFMFYNPPKALAGLPQVVLR
jgi:hypothetical protein